MRHRQMSGMWRQTENQKTGITKAGNQKTGNAKTRNTKKRALMLASVASMIDQFNMSNIRLLLEMGYEVHVACNFSEGNTCDEKRVRKFRRALHEMHVVSHQWDCPRSVYAAGKCLKAFAQLWRLTGHYHFLWIHCHSPVGGALARLAAHGRKIRVIYTAHGFHFYQGAPLKNWLVYYPAEKLLSYWTDVLVTVNKEDYRFAKRRLNAGKVFYIPGVGVDLTKFSDGGKVVSEKVADSSAGIVTEKDAGGSVGIVIEKDTDSGVGIVTEKDAGGAGIVIEKDAGSSVRIFTEKDAGSSVRIFTEKDAGASAALFRRMYRIPEHAFVVLSTGELNRGKNHQLVLTALAQLQRQDVYYLICGQGRMRKKLRRYAARLGIGGRVRMPGFQENMPWICQNADIFVFPSVREGMPVALMEAMAAGLPCVASDIRGNRELVRMRFAPDQPGQLAEMLERLLADSQLRKQCGQENRKRIRGYTQDIVQKKMEMIYQEISLRQG